LKKLKKPRFLKPTSTALACNASAVAYVRSYVLKLKVKVKKYQSIQRHKAYHVGQIKRRANHKTFGLRGNTCVAIYRGPNKTAPVTIGENFVKF